MFRPGQYLEWTVPHPKADSRGVRRYFTIASPPGASMIRLAAKIPAERPSSFKRQLHSLEVGAYATATGPAGDFSLPPDPARKLVWLAGGIGITPFVSMAGVLHQTRQHRDIALLYLAARPDAFAYRDELNAVTPYGLTTHYILTDPAPDPGWGGPAGPLTAELIRRLVPDFAERTFYLSGPSGLVRSQRRLLRSCKIPRHRIRIDDFPGF
jgi:ferredoxin-NADP reductase